MKKFAKVSVVTSLAAVGALGLLFQSSLISNSSAAQNAKIVKLQATNKSKTPRTVQIVLDGATLDLSVLPKAVVLSEGENVRMSSAMTTVYAGQVRISIQKNGKEPFVLKADKATIKYSQAWFPFSKKS